MSLRINVIFFLSFVCVWLFFLIFLVFVVTYLSLCDYFVPLSGYSSSFCSFLSLCGLFLSSCCCFLSNRLGSIRDVYCPLMGGAWKGIIQIVCHPPDPIWPHPCWSTHAVTWHYAPCSTRTAGWSDLKTNLKVYTLLPRKVGLQLNKRTHSLKMEASLPVFTAAWSH